MLGCRFSVNSARSKPKLEELCDESDLSQFFCLQPLIMFMFTIHIQSTTPRQWSAESDYSFYFICIYGGNILWKHNRKIERKKTCFKVQIHFTKFDLVKVCKMEIYLWNWIDTITFRWYCNCCNGFRILESVTKNFESNAYGFAIVPLHLIDIILHVLLWVLCVSSHWWRVHNIRRISWSWALIEEKWI